MSGIRSVLAGVREALVGFEARRYSGEDAALLVDDIARTEKVLAAARTQAALRAGECGAHKDEGFANPSEWLSRKTGSSSGEARAELALAARLDDLPDTKAALDAGEVSLEQAGEIAKTETECPGTEAEMLATAKRQGLRALKEQGRRRRQEAVDPEELAEKRRRARELRRWTDELGMRCGSYRLEPHLALPVEARLDAEVDRAYRAGDAQYRAEPREARAADALVTMLEGKGRGPTTRPEIVAVFDAEAGRAHVPGAGPIDHATLADLARDAIVTAVVHDGVDVRAYKRWSRHVPKVMRLLLSLGPPPDFDGATCERCGRRFHLQLDHVDPVANGGATSWHQLEPLCPPCHLEKTEDDRRAGLLGGSGRTGRRAPDESVRMAPRMARRHTHTPPEDGAEPVGPVGAGRAPP